MQAPAPPAPGEGEANALSLEWAFGFNTRLAGGVHNLSDESRFAVFYVAAHTGVIYDCAKRTQTLLQGHCNPISATAVSADRRWLATADAGADSLLVVWDAHSGIPVRTFFNPSPHGVVAIDLSPDGRYLATLSAMPKEDGGFTDAQEEQVLAIWDWTADDEGQQQAPLLSQVVPVSDVQTCVRFNPRDPQELVTNGSKQVLFWSREDGTMTCYSPKLSKRNFRASIGAFTGSCFLPDATPSPCRAITGTADGSVVLWDVSQSAAMTAQPTDGTQSTKPESDEPSERAAVKAIGLGEGALTVVTTVDSFIVLAGEDGAVRFYDLQFRLEAWFEDLEAGPVTSVSFSSAPPAQEASTLDFCVPDMVIGTRSAYIVGLEAAAFEEVEAEARRGVLLVQGMNDEVHGVATHPSAPVLVLACYSGGVFLWDYDTKVLALVRQFDASRFRPRCVAYAPSANYLAVGFTSGIVKILDPDSLEDVVTFKNATAPIVELSFSPLGDFLAAADAENYVLVWKLKVEIVDDTAELGPDAVPETRASWTYVGRYRSHAGPITALEFGLRDDGRGNWIQALVSTGEDRRLVEYNLEESSVEAGLLLKEDPTRIEVAAVPTAAMWHPLLGTGDAKDYEDRVITANSEYKLMEWNADNKACRRTTLGPTFGPPINCLRPLVRPYSAATQPPPVGNDAGEEEQHPLLPYLAYATAEKVVGLAKMPLDGNPARAMGLIAHPGQISAIAVSFDGNVLVSAGGNDETVNVWSINTSVLDVQEAASRQGIDLSVALNDESSQVSLLKQQERNIRNAEAAPFVAMLDGGEGGDAHSELVDFFYYAQLRTQGEESTAPREITGRVPLSEIPNLVRSLGYYPSEAEVRNMVNEVKYSEFTTTGQVTDSIDLGNFIRLYVNHRPVLGVDKPQVEQAFGRVVTAAASEDTRPRAPGTLTWAELKEKLTTMGEAFSEEELQTCIQALTGADELPDGGISASAFIDQVLGFEDYDAGAPGEVAAM